MRVVFIRSNSVNPYPRLEKTANSLMKNGLNVHILAWDRNAKYLSKSEKLYMTDGEAEITRFGIPGIYGGGFKSNLIPLIKFQKNIGLWLFRNRKNFDVIHAYDLDTGLTAFLLAKILNKKIIYDIPDYYIDSHGLAEKKIGNLVRKTENFIINNSHEVIICTEKRKDQISGTHPKNLTIIHNSPIIRKHIDKKSLYNKSLNKEKIKVVYVGILGESRFIKEIAEVIVQRKDCEFHIGGFGMLEEHFKIMEDKYDNIFFYGKIPYQETLRLEEECDIMTAIYDPKVPNHVFAAPNKFYEALMLGKPLIMVKNTGMDSEVEKNSLGEVIDYSVESLNNAIDNLIKKRNEWLRISERGQAIYKEKYSWEIMEERLFELYERVGNIK